MTINIPVSFVDWDFLDDYEYDAAGRLIVVGDKAVSKARSRAGALPPGTAYWGEPYSGEHEIGDRFLGFICPCGCGQADFIIASQRNPNERNRAWQWDGNMEQPTITPSIFRSGAPCQWHGFLTKGTWTTA